MRMRVKEYALGVPTILMMIAFALANQSHASPNDLPEVESLTLPSVHDLPSSRLARNIDTRSPVQESGMLETNYNMLSVFKKINALQQEVQELRGRLEEQDYLIKKLQAGVTHEHNNALSQSEKSQVVNELKQSAISSFSFGGSEPESVEAELQRESSFKPQSMAPSIPEPILDEKQAYDDAFSFIQAKDYKKAEESLNALLLAYPHGEYAPNAYYWLGEVHSVQGNTELAKHAFKTVVEKFGYHHKVADAKLKLGFAEHKLGDYKMAKQYLESIVNEHPGSATARLAKVRLSEMKNDGII